MQAMNQMFVIDIYLNKFKNHFCSINPRFFRYFACGLNGYVGMIDFNSHQWIKYGFVAFAVAIALASLLFSNKLVRELTIEERNKIEIWAKATEHLATETDNSDMNLVLRILQGNTTIPVILYDKSNRSFIVNNIKLPDKGRDRFLQKKMEAFSKKRNAIELTELNQSLYYDDSYTLKQLQVFPYVQLAVIAFFIALVFFALRNSLKAQQNRVWVGLSKETAHQLGTPISSLVAWIEFLKLKDIDPALLSEIDKDVHRLEMIARRFSKIGSATDLRQADLREVVRRSLGYMEKRISDKVRIDLDFPEHGVTVTVSEPLFDWVIENLLKNAVDAMGGEGTVLFHISERRGKVLFGYFRYWKRCPEITVQNPFLSRIHHQGAWLGTWPVACEADCGGIPQRKDFCEGIGAWERNHVQDGAEMIIYLEFNL